jgi:cob(I)alamin adenosyltransferase
MSITTRGGDAGETSLPGGARVSKANARVEAYGTVDELISVMGLARALCPNAEIRELSKRIQKELFSVGGALAAEPAAGQPPAALDAALVDALTGHVHRIEALPGLLDDWALPGEDAGGAAYDVARTVCRRAERLAVALDAGGGGVPATAIAYLNRLSDLLWLFGRQLEKEAGVDARLRESGGARWSKAW